MLLAKVTTHAFHAGGQVQMVAFPLKTVKGNAASNRQICMCQFYLLLLARLLPKNPGNCSVVGRWQWLEMNGMAVLLIFKESVTNYLLFYNETMMQVWNEGIVLCHERRMFFNWVFCISCGNVKPICSLNSLSGSDFMRTNGRLLYAALSSLEEDWC